MLRRLLLFAALLALGCAGPRRTGSRAEAKVGEGECLSQLELTVAGMTRAEAEQFKRDLEAQGDIQAMVLKSHLQGTAIFELDVRGCECDLPAKIANIRSPGLKYEGRTTKMRYSAFDNHPPSVSFVFPESGRVLTERELLVTVEVPDADVAEVVVNDQPASRLKP